MLAIIFDEGNDLIFQVLHRMEIASPNDFPGEGGKPNLDLVKPGCMGRREVKDNRLVRRRQEGPTRRARRDRRQGASAASGHDPAGQFMVMGIEVVQDNVYLPSLVIQATQPVHKIGEYLCGAVGR